MNDFNEYEGFSDFAEDTYEDDSDSLENGSFYERMEKEEDIEEPKLKYKTVGVVIFITMIVLASIVFFFSQLKITKKVEKGESSSTSPQVVDTNTGLYLRFIDNGIKVDFSGEVKETQGVVTKLEEYLVGNQVVCHIEMKGQKGKEFHYFSGYNVYSQLCVGDSIIIEYKEVSEKGVVVCTIRK